MFKIEVLPWAAAQPYLGIGTYYYRPKDFRFVPNDEWVSVCFEQPLMLDARQVRMLAAKYETTSVDQATAALGAKTLWHDVLNTGHDGIVAIEEWHNKSKNRLVVVKLELRSADNHSSETIDHRYAVARRSTQTIDHHRLGRQKI